jgi:hypothetical protein
MGGFLDKGGGLTTLDAPESPATIILGLNKFGVAVGVETVQLI